MTLHYFINETTFVCKYVAECSMVEENSQKAASRMKDRYDVQARAAPLLPGGSVLVHRTRRDKVN